MSPRREGKNPGSVGLQHRVELGRMCHPGGCCQPSSSSPVPKDSFGRAVITLPSVFLNWFLELARMRMNTWSSRSSRLKILLVFQVLFVFGPLPASGLLWKLFQTGCLLCMVTSVSTFNSCFFFLSFLRHLDFFEMLRNEDELEFAKRFELVSVNITASEPGS